MTSLSVAEGDNNNGTNNDDDSFKTALTSKFDDNELALDSDNTMSQRLSKKVGGGLTLLLMT